MPAGLDDDAEADGDDAEADEDGDEPGEDEEDGVIDGPPATGCFLWAGDDLGCADCNGDGLAVTKPNGWPAQGTAFPAGPVSASDPTAPASAAGVNLYFDAANLGVLQDARNTERAQLPELREKAAHAKDVKDRDLAKRELGRIDEAEKVNRNAQEAVIARLGDKQFTEVAEVEAPAELVTLNATGEGEEIGDVVDLEAALGGGIRKAPGVVSALDEEAETAETAL